MASRGSGSHKRPHPPLFGGVDGSSEDRDSELLCPVCLDLMSEPYVATCGHSFCHSCICRSLEHSPKCPLCGVPLSATQSIFPNVTLHTLLVKKRKSLQHSAGDGSLVSDFTTLLDRQKDVCPAELKKLQELLASRQLALDAERKLSERELLKEFLLQIKRKKEEDLRSIQQGLERLYKDLQILSIEDQQNQEPFTLDLGQKRVRMAQHFNDLEAKYWLLDMGETDGDNRLSEFQSDLNHLTRYSELRPLATLSYGSDLLNAAHIVSSIEFDRDADFFAIAGVTKRIKVYEYATVVRDLVDMHYPVVEMVANSKISCVSWSSYHKSVLCSSDYEGNVSVWDAGAGSRLRVFQEHEKRCWSVDFNRVDAQLLASGSDDSRVKIWSLNSDHSVATLEAKANVCCVKFNPFSRYCLAYGAADHCVHYVDLRQPKEPLRIFKGHRKAVSYVQFVNEKELVSASTDSQLKLWSVEEGCGSSGAAERRTFRGHTNEKNFVGLANNGQYVACGSENNALYLYAKGLGQPLLHYKFDVVKSALESHQRGTASASQVEEDSAEFISAVCWKPNSNVILAANSQGTIKILELV